MVWVGDESKCPHKWIKTWQDNHPDWAFKLWGNKELNKNQWQTKKQMDQLAADSQWPGVADCMRYEILYKHGGVYVDADSVSLKPLDDFLLQAELFAVYENEALRPGLIANGYIGSVTGNPILEEMIERIASKPNINRLWRRKFPFYKHCDAWETTGPKLFTKVINKHRKHATIWPSILFLPQHHSEQMSRQKNISYADHYWGSTKNLF